MAELADSACAGDVSKVAALAKRGIDVNARGERGMTPLRRAVECANVDGVTALLVAGAQPNRRAGNDTPVVVAAKQRNSKILQILLQHGGDPNAIDAEGNDSALSHALSLGIRFEEWQNYYLLLDSGADIQRPVNGMTIAERALVLGRPSKVIELVERGYRHDIPRLIKLTQVRKGWPGSEGDANLRLQEILRGLGPAA